MKNIALDKGPRPFLPPLVTLTHEHGATVALATAYDEGLSNDAAVERLYLRAAPPAPRLELDNPWGTIDAYHLDKPRRVLLSDLDFSTFEGQTYLDYDSEDPPVRELDAALEAGFALDERLLAILAADDLDGEVGGRRRAWREADLALGGAWDRRTQDEDLAWRLVGELREAIRDAGNRAIHLTPLPDGSLRRRRDPWGGDLDDWSGHYGGAAMVVLMRHEGRLNALVPSRHWLAQRLQALLLEAWALESFGADARWTWKAADAE